MSGLLKRIRKYLAPPPLSHISDYNQYWENRKESEHEKITGKKNSNSKVPKTHRKVILSEILEDGKTLLDVGSGNCSFFDRLSKAKPNLKLTGVEISDSVASIGRKKGYEVFVASLSEKPIDKTYDYITILNVLEHTKNAEEILLNVKDAFSEKLYISVPNLGFLGFRIKLALFGSLPNTGCFYHIREHIRFWTYSDFIHWVDFYGFKVTNCWSDTKKTFLPWHISMFSRNILYELERK